MREDRSAASAVLLMVWCLASRTERTTRRRLVATSQPIKSATSIGLVGGVIIAWALSALLAPLNRALSLLAAWCQLVYAAVALCGVFGLLNVINSSPNRITFSDPARRMRKFGFRSIRFTTTGPCP
jgi:hypothetical protein